MASEGATPDGRVRARVEHNMPGRVRVRIARGDRSPAHMERLRQRLQAHPDVSAVQVNPQTGSVLVRGARTERR